MSDLALAESEESDMSDLASYMRQLQETVMELRELVREQSTALRSIEDSQRDTCDRVHIATANLRAIPLVRMGLFGAAAAGFVVSGSVAAIVGLKMASVTVAAVSGALTGAVFNFL